MILSKISIHGCPSMTILDSMPQYPTIYMCFISIYALAEKADVDDAAADLKGFSASIDLPSLPQVASKYQSAKRSP